MSRLLVFLLPLAFLLAGCDQVNEALGLEDQAKKEARLEADGKAVGGACRQSGRAIEDCYAIYSWLPRAAIFAGWRDMDTYMRENNIDTVEPQLPPVEPPGTKKRPASPESDDEKPAPKDSKKPPAKTESDKKEKEESSEKDKAKEPESKTAAPQATEDKKPATAKAKP